MKNDKSPIAYFIAKSAIKCCEIWCYVILLRAFRDKCNINPNFNLLFFSFFQVCKRDKMMSAFIMKNEGGYKKNDFYYLLPFLCFLEIMNSFTKRYLKFAFNLVRNITPGNSRLFFVFLLTSLDK